MSRRILIALAILLIFSLAAGAGIYTVHSTTAGSRAQEHENEQIVYRGVTACGVERWWIKTGIDGSAHLINTARVVSTSVYAMRRLPAPNENNLPSRSRIRPVETTDFTLSAILLRYKVEQDSDVHLVIADTGGRTMIAEIPAYQCVGSNSPFLSQIRALRRAFDSHFRPTDVWQRLRLPVTLTGIGYFDFHHGQSGVAPNAVELHPLLKMSYSGSLSAPPTAAPPPVSHPGGHVSTGASVSDSNPARYSHVTVYGHFKVGGKGVSGVPMDVAWHFKTGTGSCSAVTNSAGTASCSRYIGRATRGYTVNIDVTFTYRGSSYSASTSFTPG